MSGLTAPVTIALEVAGPPAVVALCNAGFQVIAHDTACVDAKTRDRYRKAHSQPGCRLHRSAGRMRSDPRLNRQALARIDSFIPHSQ
jgi:hypothetical protein